MFEILFRGEWIPCKLGGYWKGFVSARTEHHLHKVRIQNVRHAENKLPIRQEDCPKCSKKKVAHETAQTEANVGGS